MDIQSLLTFVRVVQAGSFSKAAKNLRTPKSTVSRRVAELERQLGVPLLHRTTRSLKITDAGSVYFEHGVKIAAEIEKAEALVTNLQSVPQGVLKITAPTDFGNQFLGTIMSSYLRQNPKVQADVVLTERLVDLIGEGFDLAIRIGSLEDSSLTARKLGSMEMQLYASPGYLKQFGEPKACADLKKHECIRFTGEEAEPKWHLKGPGGTQTLDVPGKISSNNMALVREFALSGEGIALMPYFFCFEDVKEGRLKPVLKKWASPSEPIHAVFPGQKLLLPRVRTFLDHLLLYFKDLQWRTP